MRTARLLLRVLMVLALWCALPATAQQPASEPAEKKVKLPSYYAMLANGADLTYEQRLKLADALAKRKARRQAWLEEDRPRLKDISAQLAQAVEQDDQTAAEALLKQAADLKAKLRENEMDFQTEAYSLLTEDQRLPWLRTKITFRINMALALREVKLDEDQAERAQALCRDAAGKLVKLELAETKKREAVWEEFKAAVIKDVLTPEQRELMAKKAPEEKPKPAPAKDANVD